MNIADLVPGLARGYAARALARRVSTVRGVETTLEERIALLRARGISDDDIVAVMTEAGHGGWARRALDAEDL